MPWNVKLENEEGKTLDEIMKVWGFVPSADALDYPLLRFIDPYGDTIFNRPQMVPFLEEWGRLEQLAQQNSQRAQWDAIKRMAVRCHSEPHTYLRFVGD